MSGIWKTNTNKGLYEPEWELTTKEAKEIIKDNDTLMEIIEHAYKLGYNRGKPKKDKMAIDIPVFNVRQMTDEEWNRLAAQNVATRIGRE